MNNASESYAKVQKYARRNSTSHGKGRLDMLANLGPRRQRPRQAQEIQARYSKFPAGVSCMSSRHCVPWGEHHILAFPRCNRTSSKHSSGEYYHLRLISPENNTRLHLPTVPMFCRCLYAGRGGTNNRCRRTRQLEKIWKNGFTAKQNQLESLRAWIIDNHQMKHPNLRVELFFLTAIH